MPSIGIDKVFRPEEKGLQALLGTGNNRCVIAEEKTAQYRHQHYGKKVRFASVICGNRFHDTNE